MAAEVVSTMVEGSTGEVFDVNNNADDVNDNDSQALRSWMKKNAQTLQDKTYQILSAEGILSIDDLKNFTVDEFNDMCNEMKNNKIAYGDRVKLKKILQSFSNKDKFVDLEEVEAIESIKNEKNKLNNLLENLNLKQAQISQKKSKITTNINHTFEVLINELRNRQKQLLLELDVIMNTQSTKVNSNIDIVNNNITNFTQEMAKCEHMVRQSIDLSELAARKLAIMEIRNESANTSKQVINTVNENRVNATVTFTVAKDDIIASIATMGVVYESIAPSLIGVTDQHQGVIQVDWRLNMKNVNTKNKYDRVRVEYKTIVEQVQDDDDEKKKVDDDGHDVWQHKEMLIEETKEDTNSIRISVDEVGVYLFRVRLSDNRNAWTPCSNFKSISIEEICATDSWYWQVIGEGVNIKDKNGTVAEFPKKSTSWNTAYGNKVVQPTECHEWKLKMNYDLKASLYIGIIPDDTALLNKKVGANIEGHLVYKAHMGDLRDPSNPSYPRKKFEKKGDTFTLKLDLKNNEASIGINGIQYGIVPNYTPEGGKSYRLAVSARWKPCELEFV